jgi:hypothetical protein
MDSAKFPQLAFNTHSMTDILDAEWWKLPSGARMQLEGNLLFVLSPKVIILIDDK